MATGLEFRPSILGFLCNWCCYAGADLAGVSRNQYPPNIRVIRVMCSGRVDPMFVIDALEKGVDGVIILGCHLGDCHYNNSGNYEAQIKYNMLKKILKIVDLEERIELNWVSAAEGTYFAEIITNFTDKIKSLGVTPISLKSPPNELKRNLGVIKQVVTDDKIRKIIGRQRTLSSSGNVYNIKIEESEFDKLIEETIYTEYTRTLIHNQIKNSPSSVKQVAHQLNLDPQATFKHFIILKQRGLIDFDTIEGHSPIYKNL